MLKYLITPSIAQAANPQEYLYSIDRDGDETFIGLMRNEDTCKAVASAMNTWAQIPPVTPLTFVCRPNRVTS
jgi:hypothetical protein